MYRIRPPRGSGQPSGAVIPCLPTAKSVSSGKTPGQKSLQKSYTHLRLRLGPRNQRPIYCGSKRPLQIRVPVAPHDCGSALSWRLACSIADVQAEIGHGRSPVRWSVPVGAKEVQVADRGCAGGELIAQRGVVGAERRDHGGCGIDLLLQRVAAAAGFRGRRRIRYRPLRNHLAPPQLAIAWRRGIPPGSLRPPGVARHGLE
jgi:hypothetical protein